MIFLAHLIQHQGHIILLVLYEARPHDLLVVILHMCFPCDVHVVYLAGRMVVTVAREQLDVDVREHLKEKDKVQ